MLVSFAAEGIVHLIVKAIEQYRRPRGMTLRVDMGGRVAVLDDVNPNSVEELRKLQNRDPLNRSNHPGPTNTFRVQTGDVCWRRPSQLPSDCRYIAHY